MSKEAMKLALEALENSRSLEPVDVQWVKGKRHAAITALREALAKPDFWEGYVPEPNSTCSNALRIQHKPYPRTCKKCGLGPCVELAQQPLDKKTENARELGLDYEPAQQEPVAWMCSDESLVNRGYSRFSRTCGGAWNIPVYTSPPASKPWVGLTDEEVKATFDSAPTASCQSYDHWRSLVALAIETKLREKNT